MNRVLLPFFLLLTLCQLPAAPAPVPTPPPTPAAQVLATADKQLAAGNYMEARATYDKARDVAADWASPETALAVDGAVQCDVYLSLWDDPLDRFKSYIENNKGKLQEAKGERSLGNFYINLPHQGTKQGGVYHRAEWLQGVRVSSLKKDRKEAILHLERARELVIALSSPNVNKDATSEQIGIDFDIISVIERHSDMGFYIGSYSPFWDWWWGGWIGGEEPEDDSSAVDDADYEQPRDYQQSQAVPQGLPIDAQGNPRFIATPDAYSASLGDGQKIRFLEAEIQKLDTSETQDAAARALLEKAVICRSLYGVSGLSATPQYDRFGQVLPATDNPNLGKKIWELGDDEAITLVAGKPRLISLSPEESPLALLELVATKFPKSVSAPDALFDRATYYQSRQQFPQALAAYQRLIETYPNSNQSKQAVGLIDTIKKPGVLLSSTSVFLPDSNPKLTFTYRNLGEVKFTVHRFKVEAGLNEAVDDRNATAFQEVCSLDQIFYREEKDWRKYISPEVVSTWTQSVPVSDKNLTAEATSESKLNEPGFYYVEATAPGAEPSHVLIEVTGTAIIKKDLVQKGLIWVADSKTGQPLSNQKIRILETWQEYDMPDRDRLRVTETDVATNQDGTVEYQHKQTRYGSTITVLVKRDNDFAFSEMNWNDSDVGDQFEDGTRHYIITDRPVYRPGNVVHFQIWTRGREKGVYKNLATEQSIRVIIRGPKGDSVVDAYKKLDENGCVSSDYTLPTDAALGLYSISGDYYAGGGQFRVEEYKKPEFEVKVVPTKTQAHLGDKVSARITATYYFGAPVSKGKVKYKVFREDYHYIYWGADEYDWLYGSGYGRCYYSYPWFTWWWRWGGFIIWDEWAYYPYYPYGPNSTGMGADDAEMNQRSMESGTRKALRDLVAQGEADLKPDGTYDVEIDTAPALKTMGDRDHRYTIEAEVRDASRRTITGQGDIKVTRQEFYGFCEVDRGWYETQEQATVNVRTLTPDNVPVASKGKVTVSQITYDQGNPVPKETPVKTFDAETDVDGRLSFTYQIPQEGQYRISYSTHDSSNAEVQANAIFWAWGPHFDGTVYHFNSLEIITDKRTYQPGDTAHLLINTAENNSRVLFCDNSTNGVLRNYRFLDLPQRSTVIDVPITEASLPNFFVEASLIRNGHLHEELREIFVPPSKNLLTVTVKADKPVYRPGDTGHIDVQIKDANGNPAQGVVTLTAFDRAITYIQDEFGPSPKTFFYGQQRTSTLSSVASFEGTFPGFGLFDYPETDSVASDYESWEGLDGMPIHATVTRARRGLTLSGYVDLDRQEPASALMDMAAPMKSMNAFGAAAVQSKDEKESESAGEPGEPKTVEPTMRQNFADTALWLPELQTDANGHATADITFPDSLTTWRIHGYGITQSTQVGDGTGETVTSKKLIVTLEAPRFFVERDEVVLSSNVHNYLDSAKEVSAEITVPAAQFGSLDQPDLAPDADGNLHITAKATVDANGEHRFDWPLAVKAAGQARVSTKALTDEESDAMELTFPVLVHGINKTVAQNGSFHVDQNGSRDLALNLPTQIDPEQTKLELTLCPSLGGVMIDALPYLIGYPYGCTEQTMDRFYPAVLVKDTLKKMGTDLETIGKQRKQMNAQDLNNRFKLTSDDPIYDSDELEKIVKASLHRLRAFQQSDGGWGWWAEDDSSPYQTAYVLQGLAAAREAGELNNDSGMLQQGLNYLSGYMETELAKPKEKQELPDLVSQAYFAYVLALNGDTPTDLRKAWLDDLYKNRLQMNHYGQALMALTFNILHEDDRAKMLIQNILQFLEKDDSNDTAWIRTPDEGWWFWWNNDIETNAFVLKALVAVDPKSDVSPKLVKWLLNNRKNGYYWRSTRDTAQVISAMAGYMRASGEGDPDYDLTVKLDGEVVKQVHVNKDNFFTFDNHFVLYGLQVKPGPHTITLEKNGAGALYYSTYLTYFTKEDDIKGAGNEIEIVREYYKLNPKTETVVIPDNGNPPANQSQPDSATGHTEVRDEWDRIPLHNGDTVTSGEQIEVVLKIHAKNSYDYLAFEDMKPAGCEPVDIRSGGKFAGGLCPNVELRDTKTVFFIGLLEQGDHILRYKLRAETPGTFHALPTSGYAMYAPEVKAISDEMKLKIQDEPAPAK